MEANQPTADRYASVVTDAEPILRRESRGVILRDLLGVFTTTRGWWLISICFAAIFAWQGRNHISPDGLSYLDIGTEASNGDLSALVNSFWSPAYPALIGSALYLLRPSAANEVPVLELLNFIIFILTLWAFSVFYRNWSRSIPELEQSGNRDKGLFTLFAFAGFLWFTSCFIGVDSKHPDMLVAALVFLVAAMGCRITRPGAGWKHFVGLGALLGAGIYVKAALFPLAFAFIALLFVSLARTSDIQRRKLLTSLAVTTAVCLAVAAPFIVALSVQEGRFTTGDTGKLNYVWWVDRLEPMYVGWTGGTAPEYGTPLHPPRKLMEHPLVLEFATPIAGTYPLWHSPGYWYAGAKPVFNLRKQIQRVRESLIVYMWIAAHAAGFVGGAILLFVFSLGKRSRAHPWRTSFWLAAWCLAGCVMYGLVFVEERYVGPFVLLLCLEAYRALVFRVERRIAIGVCVLVLLVAMTPLALSAARSLRTTVSKFGHPVDDDYIVMAHSIQRLGLQPGDKLALVGDPVIPYYLFVRCDRLRVVSQIEDPDEFWRLNPAEAKTVENRMASIGVKALLAFGRPASNQETGWTELAAHKDGSLSVLLLQPATDGSR